MGAAKQWVKVSWADTSLEPEITGSIDLFMYVLKHLPRGFSRSNLHTGMLNLTGATGSGKGTVLYSMQRFGGEENCNLVHSLGPTYLHEKFKRGSEECKPVLAGAVGKAILYCDDYPNEDVNPDTIKPLVESRGGRVSARFGGGRDDQATSLEISWGLLIGTGNYKLRIPYGAAGIIEKIPEVTPPFRFVNSDQVTQPGHVAADPAFAASIDCGAFAAEYFWLIRQLARFVLDPALVKGRSFGPIPAKVAATMEAMRVDDAGCLLAAFLEAHTHPVSDKLESTNVVLVQLAYAAISGEARTHITVEAGLTEVQVLICVLYCLCSLT